MKKHHLLAAVALLALTTLVAQTPAQAQSKVTLYGLVDVSVGSAKLPGAAAIRNVENGRMSTSYIGFTANEDLGGGLSAFITLDSFLRADNGNNGRFNGDVFWSRNAFVGLSSTSFGTLRAGRNTTPLFVSTVVFNAFGDSYGYSPSTRAIFTSGTVSGDSGWSDSVQYLSPRFGGFNVGAIVAAGEGAGGRNWGVNAGFGQGAFAASAVYQNVAKNSSATTAVDDTKTWLLSAAYDLGVVKLFGQAAQVDNDSTRRDYKIGSVGASVPVGQGKFLAQYGRINASVGADRKTFSAGYDYLLSKRTDLYAVAMSDKLTGLSGGSSYSVGIRHRF